MLSALDLARRIETGSLTPARVVELCAEAIAAREAEVQAFATLNLDAAREAALAPALREAPLRGLPVALKDIFDTADMATEYGSRIYAGQPPASDASVDDQARRRIAVRPSRPSSRIRIRARPATPQFGAHPGGSSAPRPARGRLLPNRDALRPAAR